MPHIDEYCPRCMILFKMAREPDKLVSMVLPPHDPRCPKIAAVKPQPLRGSR